MGGRPVAMAAPAWYLAGGAQTAEIGRKRKGPFGAIDGKKQTFLAPGLAAACDPSLSPDRELSDPGIRRSALPGPSAFAPLTIVLDEVLFSLNRLVSHILGWLVARWL